MKMNKVDEIFITFFFIGRIKKIPGTLASLISLVPGWIILNYTNTYIFLLVIIVYTVISYFYTVKYIKTQNDKDPKEIVADEVVAMWTILLFIPINIQQYILCFIIFRFFDISKIYPINTIEKKYKNAFGIFADDIMAAIYTITLIKIIHTF
tara:strand:- start:943 stop:1398 length:456 start_codon:yes stop_codon:yes gene_type:complete